jgi:hypothetical protein
MIKLFISTVGTANHPTPTASKIANLIVILLLVDVAGILINARARQEQKQKCGSIDSCLRSKNANTKAVSAFFIEQVPDNPMETSHFWSSQCALRVGV